MTNTEIEIFLEEKGYEFVDVGAIGEGELAVFSNWRKTAVVITNSQGRKILCLEVDTVD